MVGGSTRETTCYRDFKPDPLWTIKVLDTDPGVTYCELMPFLSLNPGAALEDLHEPMVYAQIEGEHGEETDTTWMVYRVRVRAATGGRGARDRERAPPRG